MSTQDLRGQIVRVRQNKLKVIQNYFQEVVFILIQTFNKEIFKDNNTNIIYINIMIKNLVIIKYNISVNVGDRLN